MTSDSGHVGPKVYPGWWDAFRQGVMFVLAVILLVYGTVGAGHDLVLLVTALILFGLIPAERILGRNGRHIDQPPTDDPSC